MLARQIEARHCTCAVLMLHPGSMPLVAACTARLMSQQSGASVRRSLLAVVPPSRRILGVCDIVCFCQMTIWERTSSCVSICSSPGWKLVA